MRNRPFIAGLAGVALCACSEERVGPPPPVPTGSLAPVAVIDASADIVSAKEKALAAAFGDAIMSPDLEKLGPMLDEDAHFLSPDMEDAHDRPNVIRAMDNLFGAFDGRKLVESRLWRTPNEQTIEWTMSGTQARPWKGVPPTSKLVTFQGLTLVWTKDDGSITDIHVYVDIGAVLAQLGAPPVRKGFPALPQPSLPTTPLQVFERSQAASADEENNVVIARSSLDALENNNETAYLSTFDDAVEVYTQEHPQPLHKDDLKTDFRLTRRQIGQLDTTVKHAWGVAQFAIVEYTIDGEQLGPISWIPAQPDTVIRLQIVDVEEIRAGRIVKLWRYDNPMQILPGTPGGPVSP
jgi:hypothetical protein